MAETSTIGRRACRKARSEVMTQRRLRAEARGECNVIKRQSCLSFQEIAGVPQPAGKQKLPRARAGQVVEPALERPCAHADPCSHFGERHLPLQIGVDPVDQGGEPLSLALLRHGPDDELRLAALTMRWNHEAPGNAVGGLRAEIAAHDMQAKIDAGRASGRGQDLTLVDIEHIRIKVDFRMAGCNRIGMAPMRGGAATVEQAGCGKHCNTGAE